MIGEGVFYEFMDSLTVDSLWGILKWGYVLAFSMYVAFSVVVMAQIRQMIMAFKGPFNGTVRLLGFVHFLVAVGALIAAVMIL